MTDVIAQMEIEIEGSDVNYESMTNIDSDTAGWHVKVKVTVGQKAVFKVRGKDTATHALITEVRSVDEDGNTIDVWDDSSGTDHESPAYPCGTEFILEVENQSSAGPVPRGGGYFRVLDEGAGGPP